MNRSFISRIVFLILLSVFSFSSMHAQYAWLKAPFLNKPVESAGFFDIQKAFSDYEKVTNLSKAKGWRPYKRWEWFYGSRVSSAGRFPGEAIYFQEWQNYLVTHGVLNKTSGRPANWKSVGPVQYPGTTDTTREHGIGRVNSIAFHPTDTYTYYAASAQGGVWKTTDAGKSWVSLTDSLPNLRASIVAIDPANADIIYLGTGDINLIGGAGGFGIGILRSKDGGKSWKTTGLSFRADTVNYGSIISRIIVNPKNSAEIVAASSQGIWHSSDSGNSWKKTLDSFRILDLKANPLNAKTLFASSKTSSIYGTFPNIFKSTDFGKSWIKLITGIDETKLIRMELAISPSDTSYVYALAAGSNSGFYSMFQSTDAGTTWHDRFFGATNILGWAVDGKDNGGQGFYDLTLAVDPKNKNTIYAGGVNMWASTNGGQSFNIVAYWENIYGRSIHADQHFGAFHPLTGQYFACNDGGVYVTNKLVIDTTALTTHWKNISGGLPITEFYALGLQPLKKDMVVAGAQDNGSFLYDHNSWTSINGGDGMYAFCDFADTNIVYTTVYNGALYKSIDGGQTFNYISQPISTAGDAGGWVTPFVMGRQSSKTIYGGYIDIWKTEDGGSTWNALSSFRSSTFQTITALAVAPSDSNVIYAARPGELDYTTNGGANWNIISVASFIDSGFISAIAVHPQHPGHLWVTFSGFNRGKKVYVSYDYAKTWKNISGTLPNVPVDCIKLYENGTSGGVYLGTDLGVFYRDTTMNDWVAYNTHLPVVQVNDISINYKNKEIYAATYGRGIWKSALYDTAITTGLSSTVLSQAGVRLYPNPNTGSFNLEFSNTISGKVHIEIYNTIGQKCYEDNVAPGTGNQRYFLQTKNLSAGTYFLRLTNSIDSRVLPLQIQ